MGTEVAELAASISVEGADQASSQLATFGKNVDASAQKQGVAADLSQKHTESLRAMSSTALVAGGSLVAGLGFGVHAAEGLETALAPIGTLLGANSSATADLTGHLKSLIAESPESADDIGMSAYTILSAGISGTANVMNTLRESQQLAEAGLGSMANATDLVTSAMNAFKGENLSAKDAAQTLFGTISLGKTTTAGLAQGFGEVAPLASAAGVSFHDLLAATAALTATGQTAATAYTGIKGALTNIIKPTSDAASAAKQFGLDFSAAHLKSVGFATFLDEIKTKTGGSVDALSKLFGSVEGVNAVLSLTGPQAQAFTDNLSKIDSAGGKLGQRADEMKDKLGNSFKEMGNQVQVAVEKGFQPLIPVVETATKGIGLLADGFSELSSPVQIGIEGLIGVVGAGLLVFGTLSKLELGFNTAKGYLQDFGKEGSIAGRATSLLGDNLGNLTKGLSGIAIGAIAFDQIGKSSEQTIGGVVGLTVAGAQLGSIFPGVGTAAGAAGGFLLGFAKDAFSTESASQELTGAIENLSNAVGNLQGKKASLAFLKTEWGDTALNAGGSLRHLGGDVDYLGDHLQALATKNPAQAQQIVSGFSAIHDESGKLLFSGQVIDYLSGRVEVGAGKFRDHAHAAKETADTNAAVAGSAGTVTEALSGTATALQQADDSAKNFKTSMDAVLGIGLDVESTSLRWHDSLQAVTKSLFENGATLDINTEQGRNNRQALLGSTEAALSFAEAQFKATGDIGTANAIVGEQINQLASAAAQMGLNDADTLTYIEDLLGIPPEARTDIHNTADVARFEATLLEQKYNDLDGRQINSSAHLDTSQAEFALQHLLAGIVQANNAAVYGPGGVFDPTAGAHGLVGLAHGGSAAGMIVGPNQPVVIGEGLSKEAVIPYDNFGDMTATIRNTGRASDFLRAALAAGGDAGSIGMQAWGAAGAPGNGGSSQPIVVQLTVDRKVLAEVLVDPISEGLVRNQKSGRRDLGVRSR